MVDSVRAIPGRYMPRDIGEKQYYLNRGNNFSASKGVRRPTRGIVLKEETFATMRLTARDGTNKLLVDGGGEPVDGIGKSEIYSNFILQNITETRQEKQQILETFGDSYIFLFGERPRVMAFNGVLLNTYDFNWEAEWWHNYDNYLRGTKCVENDSMIFLSFDNTLIGGYILSAQSSKSAQERHFSQFSFEMFVTAYSEFSVVGNTQPNKENLEDIQIWNQDVLPNFGDELFRPKLLDSPTEVLSAIKSVGISDNKVVSPSLSSSIVSGLSKVLGFWISTKEIINSVASTISGLQNGDNIRVPIGFAGALAFDDDSKAKLTSIKYDRPIQYTSKFSDNEDEYVGQSSHYGSSEVHGSEYWEKGIRDLGYTTTAKSIADGNALVKAATKTWQDQGISVSSKNENKLSRLLIAAGLRTGFGLFGSAATRTASIASSVIGRGAITALNLAAPVIVSATSAPATAIGNSIVSAVSRFSGAPPNESGNADSTEE